MTDKNDTAIHSGISKHLHTSNPDPLNSENLYSADKSSKNKDDSYQTLEGVTVPSHTDKKINPFNVKGVPGCTSCGGSGWKESAWHPHPCNECAKITVPNIDTYLTKVGETSSSNRDEVIPEKLLSNRQKVEQQKQVPVTNRGDTPSTVAISSKVQSDENTLGKADNAVTWKEERSRDIPGTKTVAYEENVEIHGTIPRNTYESTTMQGPITRTKEEITTTYFKPSVPYSEEHEISREIPATSRNEVFGQVPSRENVTIKETTRGTETYPESRFTDINKEIPPQTTVTYQANDGQTFSTTTFKGQPDCKHCHGSGMRKSTISGKLKPCKHCVTAVGNCPECGNTGWRSDKNKKCYCARAK